MSGNRPKPLTGNRDIIGEIVNNKLIIVVIIAVLVLLIGTLVVYTMAKGQDERYNLLINDFNALSGNYTALQGSYDGLNGTYNKLVSDNADLKAKYGILNSSYTNISIQYNDLLASSGAVNARLNAFAESEATLALAYTVANQTSGNTSNKVVVATVYNVGKKDASRITVTCTYRRDGNTSTYTEYFSNVLSLEKRTKTWVFPNTTEILEVKAVIG